MRRRSERKKSTEVSSPAVARRSGRRSRKSPTISESEKNADEYAEVAEEADSKSRASSEEPLDKLARRSRSTRKRTPQSDRGSPSKRKNLRNDSPEPKIDSIPEEENGGVVENVDDNASAKEKTNLADESIASRGNDEEEEQDKSMDTAAATGKTDDINATENVTGSMHEVKEVEAEVTSEQISEEVKQKEVIGNSRSPSPKAIVDEKSKTSDILDIKEDSQEEEGKFDEYIIESGRRSFSSVTNEKEANNRSNAGESKHEADEYDSGKKSCAVPPVATSVETIAEESRDTEYNDVKLVERSPIKERCSELDSNENSVIQMDTNSMEQEKLQATKSTPKVTKPNADESIRTRKRRWLSKKTIESKSPILAITTDSLKGLIADVHPVPLSDVRLDSSPEVEEVASEREEGEETPSPVREDRQRNSVEKILEKPAVNRIQRVLVVAAPPAAATVIPNLQRLPSPARNQASNVLYITNLVRPFTVLQLKGLLARTGKIVENGFWIDHIKSKCFVQYETEDEAIETRHALHGVRWPVSNPKCLNVDFGSKADMDRAVESTKTDGPKLGQDNKDNQIVGSGWNRGERGDEHDKKNVRPMREWDVGKKENLEREKNRETEKRRSRERERERGRERDVSLNRENDKANNERKPRNRGRERSHSMSPVRKIQKKENEPPLRLLDDLFRKTKATPCVYWLPLTPEQIAEKQALRQKRIEEHKERMKQRELEREKERNRNNDRDRDRDRDRRNRSSDRRRSRSRDRRRY